MRQRGCNRTGTTQDKDFSRLNKNSNLWPQGQDNEIIILVTFFFFFAKRSVGSCNPIMSIYGHKSALIPCLRRQSPACQPSLSNVGQFQFSGGQKKCGQLQYFTTGHRRCMSAIQLQIPRR